MRDEIIKELLNSEGKYISGEGLGKKLGVSRNAVSKAVRSLRSSGYDIESAPRRGYRLRESRDILSVQSIEKFLTTEGYRLEVYQSLASTNKTAKEAAVRDAPQGLVIVAESQAEGYGRFGRDFYSPSGTGLYMSILLRPHFSDPKAPLLVTAAAAVAVAEAAEAISSRRADIKWVNDIYMDDQKICGILAEGAMDLESMNLQYIVLGIGINIRPPENGFPENLQGIAGVLFPHGCPPDTRSRLAADILDRFSDYYANIETRNFVAEYRVRSNTVMRNIRILEPGGAQREAYALRIDDHCGLVVRLDTGEEKTLLAGEISIRL